MTYSDQIAIFNEAGFPVGRIITDKGGNIVFDPSLTSFTVAELRDVINKMIELADVTHKPEAKAA